MEISFCTSPMAPNAIMVAKSTSPSNPEENGKVEGNMLSRESSLEFSWIESLAVPVFVIDLSQYVTGWNRRTAELTRISSQDILDRQLSSITHPDSLERLEIAVKEIEKGADSSVCDLTFPSCGVLRHFHIKLSAQKNASGKTSWIVCFAEEIKMPITGSPITPISECALPPASTERVFRRLDFPVFGLTFDGVITMWSSHIEKITGYPRDGVLGRLFVDYVPGDAHRKRVEGIFRAVKRDEACNSPQEIDVLLQNGKTKRVLLNVSAYRDTEDHTGGVFVVMTDASELYNYDGSLEVNHCESSGELATLIENSHAPIFGVNRNGEIDLWNKMSAELLGFSREFVLGKSLLESFIDPFFRQSVQAVLDVALDGNGTANYELEFQTKSGQSRYLLANISSRRNSSGQVKGVVVFAQDVTESAQNDRAVAARARELRQLVDTANAPIFGVDTAGRVNEWNDKTAEITGFSGDEAFNQPLVEAFIVPALQPSVQEVLYNALRGRSTSNFELEIRTKANETRYLLVNATTRRDAENNIVGVVGIAQDVTEACKHDRAVAAMANELRQLIDTANAPIFGIDRDGDVNEWNDKTAEITGYTKEEAFDCSLVETFIVPSMRDGVQDVLDNALEGRGTSNYELEFRTKSNEIRHLLVNATTRRDAENNVVGVVGVAQDVTEAVQRDRAVAGMALELRQLIDTANAPIFGIDIDGNVNEWNRRTSEITGYTKEEAFDEPLVETFIAESMQDKVQEILDSALAGNETSNYELEFVSKSGEPIFLLVNATTRRDPENVVVGVVGVAQDVTEDRKHAQALREMHYLRASQEAKVETERNMTAYFAHELRNPLGAIDSALNAMPDVLPEAARSLISGMQLCTGFMSSIMNNLLDVRKMEEGKMKLSKSPISLKKLLNNVHKMLLPSVRPGVKFEKVCRTKRGKDWILGDAHRIQQVMTNVVTNAIKYTVTGSVTLCMGWEDDQVKFECVDTGPGIPKNEQEKLFQRFVQRGGAPGTGLGLAIAKHLVDLTGGSIRFDSDPTVKAGTTCVVLMSLPLCDAPDSVVEESTALIEEPITFLIIDDIKMNRMMLKRRLMKGIAPNSVLTEAATGEEALEICGKEKFDVIVVDQYMEEAGGVMVGTDVVFAMRRMRIDSVIIGCSGNDMGTQFFEAGADWVWQKPMPSNVRIIQDLRTSLNKRANARRHNKP